jgi:hypothetical protein
LSLIPWDYGVAKKPREDDSRRLQAENDSSDSLGEKKSGKIRIFEKAPFRGLVA